MMQEGDLREYVRKKLGHSLFRYVWGLLLQQGYVDDVLCGARDRDWLVSKAREILNTRTPAREPIETPADEPTAGHERAWALSQLVAHYAKDDPDVVRFRSRYLTSGVIAWADLEKWIDNHAMQDGERTTDITFTLPRGTTVERKADGPFQLSPAITEITGGISHTARTIPYARPGDRGVSRIAVTANGVLDRLRVLADGLADSFGWQPVQAVVFVLTGITPLIPVVRATAPAIKVRNGHDVSWAGRIKLDIDPAASSQEVLDAFEHARAQHRPAAGRRLSPKHLRLAAFTGAEHADMTWSTRHQLWNETFPDWAYSAQSNFRRDAALAQQRVLYPGGQTN